MEDQIHNKVKAKLEMNPKRLTNLKEWLYVVINTAKSMIDNTSKDNIDLVLEFARCDSVSEIQQKFDVMQGRFGREGFSKRHSPSYIYLCSLIADFSDRDLSDEEKQLIVQYSAIGTYLLYEI